MNDIKYLFNDILQSSAAEARHILKGKNILIKNLFHFLISKKIIDKETIPFTLLCTKGGIILNYVVSDIPDSFIGYKLSDQHLSSLKEQLFTLEIANDFILFTYSPSNSISSLLTLKADLECLLTHFDESTSDLQYIIDSLDSLEIPIAVFDDKPAMVYGNTSYCDLMHINDRSSFIGMNVNDLFKETGIAFRYPKGTSNRWRMYDVLNTGKKITEFDMYVEAATSSDEISLVSNNMFPVKRFEGDVSGIIELLMHNKMNISKVNKLVSNSTDYTFDSIQYSSKVMEECINQAKHFANSRYNVLVTGESGVGKEIFAQAIHNYSDRRNGPFIALNCANFPENLIESELFGYVGGAFTGASKNGQIGKFELADGGTLFLDEIGDLPLHFQSKLLRVLETGRITRIGSSKEITVDVRIIAATNFDLKKMVDDGLFRMDLYYRLQVLNIEIPPLRSRPEDIITIAESFLLECVQGGNYKFDSLSRGAKDALVQYSWPGNVRELRNTIYRISLLSQGDVISREDIEKAIYNINYSLSSATIDDTPETRLEHCQAEVDKAYKNLVEEALEIAEGSKRKAAELLDVSRATFYRMLEKYCGTESISKKEDEE